MQYSHLIVLKAPIKKQVSMDITVTTNGLVFVLTFSVPALRADLFIIFFKSYFVCLGCFSFLLSSFF